MTPLPTCRWRSDVAGGGVVAEAGAGAGRKVVPGARPRMLAAPAAPAAHGAAWGFGRSLQAQLGSYAGGGDARSGRGLGRAVRPAQTEVSPRRRGSRGGGRGGGAGASPATRAVLRETPSLFSRSRHCCGVGARGAGDWDPAASRRAARAASRLLRGASQLLLPLSREAAAPRLPLLPQLAPGGARPGFRGRRALVQGLSPP